MNTNNKRVLPLVAAALVAGGVITLAVQSMAQTDNQAAPPAADRQLGGTDGQIDPFKAGHVGSNGVREELLTGDTAEKARSAALAAVPGGTVLRVETDAEGAVYEAHMTDSGGNPVTVKFDNNFNVTATEQGPDKRK